MLRIHETVLADGTLETTCLSAGDDGIGVHIGNVRVATLPVEAVDRIMDRYGKPLADGIALSGPTLALGGDRVLCMLRHRARYDVIARDFLVFSIPGAEPMVELATSVSAAITHLARAMAVAGQ